MLEDKFYPIYIANLGMMRLICRNEGKHVAGYSKNAIGKYKPECSSLGFPAPTSTNMEHTQYGKPTLIIVR